MPAIFCRCSIAWEATIPEPPTCNRSGSSARIGARRWNSANAQKFAEYLASVNLSSRPEHDFEFKAAPRPTGRATRVIITEYDLPRKEIQPHDVIVDRDGAVWYSHFGEQFLGKLDPKTGKVTDYPIPVHKPNHPKGTLDLEQDDDGDIWIGLMYQSGVARFNRASEKMHVYQLPAEWQTDATQQSHFSVAGVKVDGKAWVKNSDRSQVMRLDVATGQYENLGTFKNPTNDRPIGIYGIYADQQNNAYILEFGAGAIGKIDAKTGKLAFYPTPTRFSRARRGRVDDQNRLWFAEFGGNAVAMFDPKTEKITEWKKPLLWEAPYDVVADRNGEAWEVNKSSRSGWAPRSAHRRVDQLPVAALRQPAPGLRGGPDPTGESLDRQQSRGLHHQA